MENGNQKAQLEKSQQQNQQIKLDFAEGGSTFFLKKRGRFE
jgi:hypothetical protein